MQIENFFYKGMFMECWDHLMGYLESMNLINNMPDDFEITCYGSKLQPIVQFSAEYIVSMIDDERFSEHNVESEAKSIEDILNWNIDFEMINAKIPKLFYEDRTQVIILTKKDILHNSTQ